MLKTRTKLALVTLAVIMSALSLFAQVRRPIDDPQFQAAFEKVRKSTNTVYLQNLAYRYHTEHEAEMAEAKKIAERMGIPMRYEDKNGRIRVVSGIDETGQLEFTETNNRIAAQTISTDEVYAGGSAGLSLSGGGFGFVIWEAGGVPQQLHPEFESRMNILDTDASVSNHATHVAGTIGAAGFDSDAQGMAYACNMYAYDIDDEIAEMADEGGSYLALLSNHSYGRISGWDYESDEDAWYWYGDPSISSTQDYKFGLYDQRAHDWDDIAYNAPFYLIVKSAGNDRNDAHTGQHYVLSNGSWVLSNATREIDGGNDGYDCIPTYGCAKNILTVGAVEDIFGGYSSPSDVEISSFSGWGPTDDGRIKPDVVGNGVGVYSTVSGSGYDSYNGTSMSTPNVAGSAQLLMEHYYNVFSGSFMRSSTMKALIIHTADEAGSNNGPDYIHGWGLMNTRKAADLITTAGNGSGTALITEPTLTSGQSWEATITSDGTTPIKVTIAWTDPAGPVSSNSLNPTATRLVNDLDLRLTRSGTTYFPWTLNPASPASAAANNADNTRDNVEQVYIAAPPAGTYTIRVSHKGTLSGGAQDFALITGSGVSGGGNACAGNTQLSSCTGTISDGSGSAEYQNYMDCSWTIAPPGATSVTLQFTEFSTESTYDVVRVFEGTNASGVLLGVFSGTSLPTSLTSVSGTMYVEWTSDGSLVYQGWSANYSCNGGGGGGLCAGNVNLTSCTGTIGDGSGSNSYENYMECSWTITPVGASSVTLQFTEFSTESIYDNVRVYQGTNASGILLGEFSGSTLPSSVTSNSGAMYVQWYTDGSITAPGWSANYTCNGGGGLCSGFTALTSCNGSISDGSGADSYISGMDCTWRITPPGATSITLNFTQFETEVGYDYVFVYQGADENGVLLGTFSGTTIPNSVTAIGGSMFVRWYSDGSITYPGWSANYSCNSNPSAVTANFSANDQCGQGSLTVNYTDLSSNATSWSWQFPGGNPATSSLQNPTVTYSTPGVYNVTLNVTGATGSDSEVKSSFITVTPNLTVTSSANTLCAGESSTLQVAGGLSGMTYSWSGSGVSGSGTTVTVTPNQSGSQVYTVAGTINGCTSNPASTTLQVNPSNTLSANISVAGCPGPILTFTANVQNAGPSPSIKWYKNGSSVGTGSTYSSFTIQNGDILYVIVTPSALPACTSPAIAQSPDFLVTCLGVSTDEPASGWKVSVFPNPSKGAFTLSMWSPRHETVRCRLYNTLGQQVHAFAAEIQSGENKLPVRWEQPAAGYYWLLIDGDGYSQRIGVMVE